MKRWTTLLIVICMLGITIPAMGAMSISKMRQNTRFLTDRMAYELKLTPQQYNDVYEVNYDFINNVRYLMDDVVRGYDYALESSFPDFPRKIGRTGKKGRSSSSREIFCGKPEKIQE